MKTHNYIVHSILATLLVGVTACGSITNDTVDEEDIDICRNAEFANIESESYLIFAPNGNFGGDIMNYDPDLRFLAFGEHAGYSDGPDDENLMGVTMFFHEPSVFLFLDLPDTPSKCSSTITSATLSTTDARIGNADEINGKLYELAEVNNSVTCSGVNLKDEAIQLTTNKIEFFYVTDSIARGWFCAMMQQVSPETGEPFLFSGFFEVKNEYPAKQKSL